MKAISIPFLPPLIPLTSKSVFAQSEPELRLEGVVTVSRHGVRILVKATQLMWDVIPDARLTWPVKPSQLTPRGSKLITYLGRYQRQCLVADGLLTKKGCPQPDQIAITIDIDERTHKTGETFVVGLVSGCAITIHAQVDTPSLDPSFNSLETGVYQSDNANMTGTVLSRAEGSIAGFTGHRQTAFRELEWVLNFPQSDLRLNREKRDESCSSTQALPSEPKTNVDSVLLAGAVSPTPMLMEILLL